MLDLNAIIEKSNSLKEVIASSPKDLDDLQQLRVKLLGPAKAAAAICYPDFVQFLKTSGFQKLFKALESEVSTKVMPEVKGYDVDFKNNNFLIATENGMRAKPILSVFDFLKMLNISEEKKGYWLIVSHCLRPEVFDVIQLSQFIPNN
jgi:hypothetical protein